MNYGRFAAAAIAAAVADMVYGFVVYGNLLQGQFTQHAAVYRPASDTSYMPILMLGSLVASAAATYIYAKGYEGGSGVAEGLRFGLALGAFALGYAGLINYAVLNIDRTLGSGMGLAAFCEWLVVGVVIGLVYKPAAMTLRKAVGV